MEKTSIVLEAIRRMMHPALPEILAYVKSNGEDRLFSPLQKYNYYNLYYYVEKLVTKKEIVRLECKDGYRKRYCVDYKVKEERKKLRAIMKLDTTRSVNIHAYITTDGRKLNVNFADLRKNGYQAYCRGKIKLVFDRQLDRTYVLDDDFLIAVIDEFNKREPRLPGPTYATRAFLTEYEQCNFLIKGSSHLFLGVYGERRAIA
jgi:hypothetical protein